MKKLTIGELRQKEQDFRLKSQKYRAEIKNREDNEIIPELVKKYLNKYFKFLNSYSCPESDEDKWWAYYHVIKINDASHCTCNMFQVTKYEGIEIKVKEDVYFSMLEVECSKEEFDINVKATIDRMKKFIK